MAFSPTSPVTGGAQTGFTSPTYTIAADAAPDTNGKQFAVTATGGTQTGVDVHSMSRPFYVSFFRPKVFKVLGKPNPTTGLIKDVPMNIFKQHVVKGLTPQAGQPSRNGHITTMYGIPAGADAADAAGIRGMNSLHVGITSQVSASVGDTLINGLLS